MLLKLSSNLVIKFISLQESIMAKILEVSEDVHMMVARLQFELLEKYKKKPMMIDITNTAIIEGINKVEEKLKDRLTK